MAAESLHILLALSYLATKHMIADFVLQMPYQYRNKGHYGHPGGLLHVAIHGLLSAPVFLIQVPNSLLAGALVLLGEMAVHYHVDWVKEAYVSGRNLTPAKAKYWVALGVDQLCHMLTYIAIVGFLVSSRF